MLPSPLQTSVTASGKIVTSSLVHPSLSRLLSKEEEITILILQMEKPRPSKGMKLPFASCKAPCPRSHSSALRGSSIGPDKCWSGNKYSSWWLWSLWSGLRVEMFAQGLHTETTESPTAPLHFIKSHCFREKWVLWELGALIIKSCAFEWLLPC